MLYLMVLIALLLLGIRSHSQSLPQTDLKICPQDLVNSASFKALSGGDRISVFHQLENLIKPANSFDGPAPDYDYFIGDYKMTEAELVFLLGEPDLKIAKCMWQYNLKPADGCIAIIGIDENALVSYMVLKNCH